MSPFKLSINYFRLPVATNFSKALMISLICMAFIGQAMASVVMPYQMISMMEMNEQAQPQNMAMMDHSHHKMNSETTEQSTQDCCASACDCYTGSCSNVAALLKNIMGHQPTIDLSAKILSSSSLALSQQPKSLYRPPISS